MSYGKADYYVIWDGSQWSIRFGKKIFACGKETVAFKAAVSAAHAAGTKGFMSQVLVEGPDGNLQTRWVYGIDRYPLTA